MNRLIALVALLGGAPLLPALEPVPAFTTGARILFQGDSITDMNRGRTTDPNHILGHSYVFIIAARHGAAFPQSKLDFVNRGISGNTVEHLTKRWTKDTLELKPDVLSIHIGVNDTRSTTPEQFEKTYDQLLTDTLKALPKVKLVLGQPYWNPKTPLTDDQKARQQAVAELAKKHGAAFVKYQPIFDEAAKNAPENYYIWDNVHPTYRGHQLMADEWEKVVRAFFK